MSPRNSGAAVNSMLRKVSAHRLMVTSSSVQTLLDDVKRELAVDDYHLDVMELPSLPDIYPRMAAETEADAFELIPIANRDAFTGGVVVYIHSSGSTGFPKPIPWTHEFISSLAHITSVKHAEILPEGTGQ
jgi:acyl-coenzyme A synthetase/AMP-(fatty) acid ligase